MSSVAARARKAIHHKTQATHNRNLADEPLFPPTDPISPYRDWVITISFYAALHFFLSYCKAAGITDVPENHKERNKWIKKTTDIKIKSMRTDYLALYKICRKARYNPLHYNKITVDDVQEYYNLAFIDIPSKLGL